MLNQTKIQIDEALTKENMRQFKRTFLESYSVCNELQREKRNQVSEYIQHKQYNRYTTLDLKLET